MLRSLINPIRTRLAIALCPTQVAVVELGRGWRVRPGNGTILPCSVIADGPEWHAPLATLRQWLEEHALSRVDVNIVLSDRFVHSAIIPWSEEVKRSAEIDALTRFQFETLFGEACAHWEIVSDRRTYGKSSLACGLDNAFVSALHELCTAHQLRLLSLQPYFVRAYNGWRNRIVKSDVLLTVAEADHCVLATMKKGEWHSIRAFRLGIDGWKELPILIQRETILQGLDDQSAIYFHSPELTGVACTLPGRELTLLDFPAETTPQQPIVKMALCGVT